MEGTSITQIRAAVTAATGMLGALPESVVGVGNAELGPFFRDLDDLSRRVEAARVAILGEALSRGVVAESDCPSATAWVIDWAPSFRSGGAAQLVTVAHATRAIRNIGLAAAVLGARVGVRNAAVALVEMDKLRPRLRDEAVEAVWEGFLQIATDHGPAEVRGLRDKIIAAHGHQGEFQRRADQLKHGVSLSQPFDDDGMAEYRLRLDPEGKEVLEAILGPLSAPKPTPTCPDLRSCDQRRGLRHRELPGPVDRHRGRVHAGRAAPGPGDNPPDGLRRDDHPRGVGHRLRGPGRRPGKTVVHPRAPARAMATRPRLHHPRLHGATVLGRRPPPHPLGRRRGHQPAQRGTPLRPPPSPSLRWGDPHIAHQRGWTATATTSEVTWHL